MTLMDLPTREQAELILRLWQTRQFDSSEIAHMARVHEAAVCRIVQAARDIRRAA